ncbi:MAG: Cof-type HAD-IIB family hydrolase [Moraxella sp.]|nr:Cof-type HAD-IIB family hydrolase [Moraxella sp.]
MKPKIVFFDIDDTLYIKKEKRIPKSAIAALKALKEAGVIVAIATGRGIGIFPSAMTELLSVVDIDVMVTINGQYVALKQDGEKMDGAWSPLVHYPMQRQALMAVSERLAQRGLGYAYMTADTVWFLSKTGQVPPPVYEAFGSLDLSLKIMHPEAFDLDTPVYQVLTFFHEKDAPPPLPAGVKMTRWHEYGVDILEADGSKARGIAAVLTHLGLEFASAAAFGDGLNDLEMLQAVGCGVAMGNAYDALKQVADVIVPRADEDGIYRGLMQLGWIDGLDIE